MLTQVSQWGNSLGVRIPQSVAKEAGLAKGVTVDFLIENDQIIIRKKNKYCLKEMLQQINENNLHHEIDCGASLGKERWE